MLKQQERELLLEKYIKADSKEKPRILARLYVIDEELKGEGKSDIQN